MIQVEEQPVTTVSRSVADIERDDIARQALEAAARRVESQQGNQLYMRAWQIAARIIRASKP